ncbi:MAG: hypothetical protein IT371_08860 [Deltaproteobacteria bacterium]|nr:hypothetical protein [Deltaproteobacteria bacterium]
MSARASLARALLGVALALAAPARVLADGGAGILRVAAPARHAARLEVSLGRAVAEAGRPGVLAPAELSVRLGGAEGVAQAVEAAGQKVVHAEQAALRMDRAAAVASATQAVAQLRAVGASNHARHSLAQAHLALGQALLLYPPDPDGAKAAFGAAVELEPELAVDPDRMAPRAARLLEEARRAPRAPKPPRREELAELAQRSRLGTLVWVSVQPRGPAEVEVQVAVYEHSRGAVAATLRRTMPEGTLLAGSAALVVQALGGALGGPPAPGLAAGAGGQGAPPPAAKRRSWYQHWWVWTVAGVVVSGTAVALGVGLTTSRGGTPTPPGPAGFDLHLHF